MSEEEKKAIETLEIEGTENNYLEVRILLNLVEKQQKEIERLKKDNIQVIYGGRRFGTEGMVVKDYISKDKIREKIKEIHNKGTFDAEIVLTKLLEENIKEENS